MQIRPNLQKQCKLVAFLTNCFKLGYLDAELIIINSAWMLLNEVLRRSIREGTQSNPSAVLEMLYLEDTYKREATCRAFGLLIIS